jgi:hypothetical protein
MLGAPIKIPEDPKRLIQHILLLIQYQYILLVSIPQNTPDKIQKRVSYFRTEARNNACSALMQNKP